MKAWKRGWARGAWTALLVLFAGWAIAGMSLCEWHGEPADLEHAGAPPLGQPSHDGGDQVCEQLTYLPGVQALPSAVKQPPAVDAVPWSYVPASGWTPAAVTAGAWPPQWDHRPLASSPLDISPRLRI